MGHTIFRCEGHAALLLKWEQVLTWPAALLFGKFSYTQYTPAEEFVAMSFFP